MQDQENDLAQIRAETEAALGETEGVAAEASAAIAAQVAGLPPATREAISAELAGPLAATGAKLELGDDGTDPSGAIGEALVAIADLSEDAAEAGAIPEDLVITLESLDDPEAAVLVAGQLRRLGASPAFKRFCRQPPPKEAKAPPDRAAPAKPAPGKAKDSLDDDLEFIASKMK